MKYEINNSSSSSVSTSPFLTKSNLKVNTRFLPQQQKEQNLVMTNEETRSLTGVVAKTRALFESTQNIQNNFSTPQITKNKINFKTYSAIQINKPKTSISIPIESEWDKENLINSKMAHHPETPIKSILRHKDDYSRIKIPEVKTEFPLVKKSFSSNRISTCSDEFNEIKPRGRINSTNVIINKSEELSKEYNIPLSVKQAKACFESLAQNSNNSPKQTFVPKYSTPSTNVYKSKADLVIGSKNPSGSTPFKVSVGKSDSCNKNIILAPEMTNSLTSSSSSTSSESSVFNSPSGSSCEITPRFSEIKTQTQKTSRVADRIKKLEELKNTDNDNETNFNSIISSSSSICSSLGNQINQTSPKYSQSSKFIQLYQKQMEVNTNSYRKLEDIINEADKNIVQKISVKQIENKEEKKLKSILRKAPRYEPLITTEVKIETVSTVRSPSCSSSSPSCSPSSSMSSLNIKLQEQKQEISKIDNASCVVPSKIRLRTQSLDNSNTQDTNFSVSNLNKMNSSFTSGIIKTPNRNVGAYIKNMTCSTGTSNTGLVKRVTRSATNAREALTRWCRKMTEEYDNVSITNFSSSWSDGLAFCALIHHFMPNEFDYSKLSAHNPRYNFDLAFKIAEDKAGIVSLLDVDDMIEMGDSPDWKCVFTYVHSIYQRFKDSC
ncbi:unnamed protein product [Brachionus calyciflorus]|uniref:Calponin-homology (CH) domain-containing protein n=1 Tax=Brachionus calyciflorus TaxID=104777 RepID=A0A813M9A1_9BILA|nr:unnamed protein product [Brachionus calyciflorus]